MWKTLRGIRDGQVYIFFAKKIPIRVCSIFQIYHGADFAGFEVIKNDVVGQDDVMLDDMDCDMVEAFIEIGAFHAVSILFDKAKSSFDSSSERLHSFVEELFTKC